MKICHIKKGDILIDKIKCVELHKEERTMQGTIYGNYSSNYVAHLLGYRDGIVVVDKLANTTHPDWRKKTAKRAEILSQELTGRSIKYKV